METKIFLKQAGIHLGPGEQGVASLHCEPSALIVTKPDGTELSLAPGGSTGGFADIKAQLDFDMSAFLPSTGIRTVTALKTFTLPGALSVSGAFASVNNNLNWKSGAPTAYSGHQLVVIAKDAMGGFLNSIIITPPVDPQSMSPTNEATRAAVALTLPIGTLTIDVLYSVKVDLGIVPGVTLAGNQMTTLQLFLNDLFPGLPLAGAAVWNMV